MMKTSDSIPIPVGTLHWLGFPLHAHQASVAIVSSSSVGRLMPTAGDCEDQGRGQQASDSSGQERGPQPVSRLFHHDLSTP